MKRKKERQGHRSINKTQANRKRENIKIRQTGERVKDFYNVRDRVGNQVAQEVKERFGQRDTKQWKYMGEIQRQTKRETDKSHKGIEMK